ncbi:hypothetical protein CDD83_8421 [Cordyceps sp. RAO-2017]|nr:hypothetical protein CDD83_8421 [Cordyceps sp. RAO-2017]
MGFLHLGSVCHAASLLLLFPLILLLAAVVEAEALERHDGVHRLAKRPYTTQAAVLLRRRGPDDVCGVSMKLCPASLGGKCCPDDYECASASCYATTKGPSTCGTKVGWYGCAAVYGGGCCPDGYMCQRAGNCVPPSGSPYTYGCPASQYLCPASMSYGCCPSGMGCGVGQCYSTEPTAVTTTMIVTTSEGGRARELTTTVTATALPDAPTTFPAANAGGGESQKVLKYYPAAIPQVSPAGSADKGGGISAGQLAGLVAGAARGRVPATAAPSTPTPTP